MAYSTIVEMAGSTTLMQRVAACAASEGVTDDPTTWAQQRRWKFAAEPGWSEAWNYAEETATDDVNPDTGARPGVINDDMILAAVQAIVELEASSGPQAPVVTP